MAPSLENLQKDDGGRKRKVSYKEKGTGQSQCTALEGLELGTHAHLAQRHLLAAHLGVLSPAAA